MEKAGRAFASLLAWSNDGNLLHVMSRYEFVQVCARAVFLLASASVTSGQSPAIANNPPQELVFDLLRVERPQKTSTPDYLLDAAFYVRPDSDRQESPNASASLYVIAQYWKTQFAQDPDRLPMALRERIVDAAETYPDWAADLAHLFPRTDEANRRLLALLDRAHSIGEGDPREQITQYLSRNSSYFRPLLLRNAQAASEGEGFVEHEEDLRALARLDWAAAEPLLDSLASFSQPRISALALGLQYEHASLLSPQMANKLRSRLKAIAVNTSLPSRARDYAVDSLMRTEWPGRDDWFLSLFDDGTLAAPQDGTFLLDTLESPVHRDPGKWIPRIARLVESSTPPARLNAIYVLVSFQQEEARTDAELPLLPWLFDPKWVNSRDSAHDRHDLLYSLYLAPVPESAPGLLHVLASPSEDGLFEAEYAARAISGLRDDQAGPVLRHLLGYPLDRDQRIEVAKALLSTGIVTMDEKVYAVARAATAIGDRQGLQRLDDAQFDSNGIESDEILGLAVIQSEGSQKPLLAALHLYGSQIRSTSAAKADAIDALLAMLPDEERDGRLLAAIRIGSVTPEDVQGALERRMWLSKTSQGELREISKGMGPMAAIATVVLGDQERELEILSGADVSAQATLFAALRLSGDMIPASAAERFQDANDPALAEAAKEYTQLLWNWHHTL